MREGRRVIRRGAEDSSESDACCRRRCVSIKGRFVYLALCVQLGASGVCVFVMTVVSTSSD